MDCVTTPFLTELSLPFDGTNSRRRTLRPQSRHRAHLDRSADGTNLQTIANRAQISALSSFLAPPSWPLLLAQSHDPSSLDAQNALQTSVQSPGSSARHSWIDPGPRPVMALPVFALSSFTHC